MENYEMKTKAMGEPRSTIVCSIDEVKLKFKIILLSLEDGNEVLSGR